MKKSFVFVAIIMIMALILGSVAMAENNKQTALERYRKAKETADQDSEYYEGKAIVETIMELCTSGKTGIDDYKAGMDYILGDGWEKKYKNDIEEANKAAKNIANRYFEKDENTNMTHFLDDLVKNNYAKEEADGYIMLGGTSTGISKALGTSKDVVWAMFGLCNSYSFDGQITFWRND